MGSSVAWAGVERRLRPEERPLLLSPPAERATPGVVRLGALRARGEVVDFSWDYADAAAARQLGCTPSGPGAAQLIDCVARALGDAVLYMRYRQVVDGGCAQAFVHLLHGPDQQALAAPPDEILHRVVCHGDGVIVTLTNLSADRRQQARRLGNRVPGTAQATASA